MHRFQIWQIRGLGEEMSDHIGAIRRRLEDMIAEAESRISGNGSILSYGMKVRRDTANEILDFSRDLLGPQRPMHRPGTSASIPCGSKLRYGALRREMQSGTQSGQRHRELLQPTAFGDLGRQRHIPHFFENAPEIRFWGEAHGSISVQERQPTSSPGRNRKKSH
jgi:hypothetical protein